MTEEEIKNSPLFKTIIVMERKHEIEQMKLLRDVFAENPTPFYTKGMLIKIFDELINKLENDSKEEEGEY